MKKIILDTSFIISCVRQKIDFFSDMASMGLSILVPKQVFSELKRLSGRNKNAELSLKILSGNRKMFGIVDLGKHGKTTDKMIINFSNKNQGIIVATLDKEIKSKVQNRKMVIRMKKKLEIV